MYNTIKSKSCIGNYEPTHEFIGKHPDLKSKQEVMVRNLTISLWQRSVKQRKLLPTKRWEERRRIRKEERKKGVMNSRMKLRLESKQASKQTSKTVNLDYSGNAKTFISVLLKSPPPLSREWESERVKECQHSGVVLLVGFELWCLMCFLPYGRRWKGIDRRWEMSDRVQEGHQLGTGNWEPTVANTLQRRTASAILITISAL